MVPMTDVIKVLVDSKTGEIRIYDNTTNSLNNYWTINPHADTGVEGFIAKAVGSELDNMAKLFQRS